MFKKIINSIFKKKDSPSDKLEQERIEREERRRIFLENKAKAFNDELSNIPTVTVAVNDRECIKRKLEEMPEIKYSKITRQTNIENLFPLVIIDVETTGLHCRKNEIIEVSAIKYESGFTPDYCFTTLCKPNSPLPDEIKDITNITDEMLSDAPKFGNIVDSLSEFVKGCNIFGYNLEFDRKFLFVNGLDFPEKKRYYDVMELIKTKLKRAPYNSDSYNYDVLDYKLDTVAKYYNIYRDNAHRSLSDCLATGKVLESLINEFIK
jgi:DNA polymerase III epsilon subunit family exonuclease